jgi:hypothetical protein
MVTGTQGKVAADVLTQCILDNWAVAACSALHLGRLGVLRQHSRRSLRHLQTRHATMLRTQQAAGDAIAEYSMSVPSGLHAQGLQHQLQAMVSKAIGCFVASNVSVASNVPLPLALQPTM